ncbi:MAG: diphosphomevalonate decarboxylase [Verrucomicrobia bacterium A1]|nr:MAG: diphosphomevalonate decarboxylase [Verrucomicrobia bacterium A1]
MTAGDSSRRRDAVAAVLAGRVAPPGAAGSAYAPANIALVKYWGKRDAELNLPVTGSLSVSLGDAGTRTSVAAAARDSFRLNAVAVDPGAPAAVRLAQFLDLFRSPACPGFAVESVNSVPTAAGVASSASGFAALVRALDALFGWRLDAKGLSILARLGSGSACRSLWDGFVEWRAGELPDGADSHGVPVDARWPELRVGLWILRDAPKPTGSREGMRHTVETSPLYAAWPSAVGRDLGTVRGAIASRDLERLGRTAEGNALAMHATAIAARPPVLYWLPESVAAMARVSGWRADGIPVWFTMDAGPNLKLLFEASAEPALRSAIPGLRTLVPFPSDAGFPRV